MPRHESYVLQTRKRLEMIDITPIIQRYLRDHQAGDGLLLVFSPHTTAGITINENADPSVKDDLMAFLQMAIPAEPYFCHGEGNSPAHIMSSLISASETLIVEQGRLVLGTWQGVFFCEYDGPRERQVYLRFIADPAG